MYSAHIKGIGPPIVKYMYAMENMYLLRFKYATGELWLMM